MTSPEFSTLEAHLRDLGFRVTEVEQWGATAGVPQFVRYERDEILVQLSHDGKVGGVFIAFTLRPAPPIGESVDTWARWLGHPLDNPGSLEERCRFVVERLPQLEGAVRRAGPNALPIWLEERKSAFMARALEAERLAEAELDLAATGHRDAAAAAWIAYTVQRAHAFRFQPRGPTHLSMLQLVQAGETFNHELPTARAVVSGLVLLKARGWLLVRDRARTAKRTEERAAAAELQLTAVNSRYGLTLDACGLVRGLIGEGAPKQQINRLREWMSGSPPL
jgi:hypothetical protein